MKSSFVSVVITSYNQRKILSRAIESVLRQTYKNIQIVIADDGSTDGSQALILQYANKYPSKIKPLISSTNRGIPRNKNTGFKGCDGDLITYLDGDDFYFPFKIEKEIECFRLNPGLDVVFSNFAYVDSSSLKVKALWNEDQHHRLPQGDIFFDVFTRNFPKNTLYRNELIRADVLNAIDYYDEDISAYHDWDSRIRMSKFCQIGYVDYVGAAYVDDAAGISKTESTSFLLKQMQYVVNKNLNLLDDLPPCESKTIKKTIMRKINDSRVRNARFFKKFYHACSQLILQGDMQYLFFILKRKLGGFF